MARAMAFPIPLDAPVHMTRDLWLLPGVVGGGSFMVMIVIVIVIVIVILPL